MNRPMRRSRRAILLVSLFAALPWVVTACDIDPVPEPEQLACSNIFDRLGETPRIDGGADCAVVDPQREQLSATFATSRDDFDAWLAEVAPEIRLLDDCASGGDECGFSKTDADENFEIHLTHRDDDVTVVTIDLFLKKPVPEDAARD